jgi:hypothetical protein
MGLWKRGKGEEPFNDADRAIPTQQVAGRGVDELSGCETGETPEAENLGITSGGGQKLEAAADKLLFCCLGESFERGKKSEGFRI